MDFVTCITSSAGVGFSVVLTGIGGGPLITSPLFMFGFLAHIATGMDLMKAAITKPTRVIIYHIREILTGYWSKLSVLAVFLQQA